MSGGYAPIFSDFKAYTGSTYVFCAGSFLSFRWYCWQVYQYYQVGYSPADIHYLP